MSNFTVITIDPDDQFDKPNHADVSSSSKPKHKNSYFNSGATSILPKSADISEFTFQQFCERMTSHGLIDFYLAQSVIAKLFWFIVLVCSLLVTAYYIYDEISEYLECPILTTITFEPQLALPFPLVYICPFQFANWDFITKCGNITQFADRAAVLKSHNNFARILGGKPNYWHQIATQAQQLIIQNGGSLLDDDSRNTDAGGNSPYCPAEDLDETFQDYIIRQAITIPMFLRECSFMSQELNCSEITTQVLDKEFGVCFQIDLGNQGIYSKQNTANLGLSLLIDVQAELVEQNEMELPSALVEGVVVRLTDEPKPAEYGGHLVQPGAYTTMAMSATKVELINYVESSTPQRCTINSNYQFSVLKNIGYTQDSCRTDCALRVMLEKCKCILPIDRKYLNSKILNFTQFDQICNAIQFQSCVIPAFNVSDDYRFCINHCFKACSSIEIGVESSQARFPSNELRTKLAKLPKKYAFENFDTSQIDLARFASLLPSKSELAPEFHGPLGKADIENPSRWSESLIILDISYKNLEYTVYEQRPSRTYTSLVANVGGQAGLWTGASMFTLFQVVLFSCYMVCNRRSALKMRRRSN